MINLIYSSFPFGHGEPFVEYEIPYMNEKYGKEYRIFTFYQGHGARRDIQLNGELYIIKPTVIDYIIGSLTLPLRNLVNEVKAIGQRSCPDPIIRCVWRMIYYRAYGHALINKVRQIGTNEQDLYMSYWINECAYAAVMLKNRYKSLTVTTRGHGFDVYDERCYLPYRQSIFDSVDCVYTVNGIERTYLMAKHRELTEDKIEVCHLGIKLPKEYTISVNRTPFRIMTCSTTIKLKRLDLLIRALAKVHEIDFEWIHIGDGPLHNEIKELAAKELTGTNQKYSFLGQLSLSDVHEYYKSHDISVFVNCSDTEGVPVSIMEAMSYGIPTIARNVGGISEIVGPDNGVLLEATENVQSIKDAILHIHSLSKEEYYCLRRNSRKKIESDFNADIQYPCYFEKATKARSRTI